MRREGQSGFVLIAVIWFVALFALVATIIAGWMSRTLGEASALQQRVAAESDAITATNEVTYLMVSEYFSLRGMELATGDARATAAKLGALGVLVPSGTPFIALDDRPYRLGKGVVSLQDNKGLYNLTYLDEYTLSHLLAYYDVPYDARSGLVDKLLDYTDKSPTKRLNGAQAQDYEQAGRPPPRQAPLITPWEVVRVLGWDSNQALWSGQYPLPELTTVASDINSFNPNTAPVPLLRSLPGVDDRAADQLVRARAIQPLTTLLQMEELTGVVIPFDPLKISPSPAGSLRLTTMQPDDPLMHIVSIRLTPNAKTPYRIDYSVDLPMTSQARADLQSPDLPQFPDLLNPP
jgi:hypothetical protein